MRFKVIKEDQKEMLKRWFAEDHVREFWYGQGLENTWRSLDLFLRGEETPFSFWIAYDGRNAFGFLIISKVEVETDPLFTKYLTASSTAITLDLLIGETAYLGKGLGAKMIQEIISQQFSDVTKVFIDPRSDHLKMIHICQKVGFQRCEEFPPPWDPSNRCLLMCLDVFSMKSSLPQ